MRQLMVLFVAIVALNLAYGTFLALMELRRSRKIRREVGTLEAMWRLDPRGPVRSDRRSVPSLRSALVAAASLVVLSGVAVASPDAVSNVTAVIGDFIAPSEGEAATSTDEGRSVEPLPSTSSPSARFSGRADDPSRAVRNDAGPDGRDDPPTMSAVQPPEGAPASDPGNEAASPPPPPIGGGETPINQDPTPTDAPQAPQFQATIGQVSSTTVQVTWTMVPSATSYRVERSLGGANDWRVASEVTADATSATIGELEAGTAYDVRVTAVLADGTEQTPTISVTTADAAP